MAMVLSQVQVGGLVYVLSCSPISFVIRSPQEHFQLIGEPSI